MLYLPEEKARGNGRMPPEGTARCEVHGRHPAARRRLAATVRRARCPRLDLPIEALAYGDRDDEFTEWVDTDEKRAELIDELPVAAVLIYRFWQDRRNATKTRGTGTRRDAVPDAARKARQRLH